MKRTAKKKNWLLRVLVALGVTGALTIAIGWLVISSWIRNYLAGDACRGMIAAQIGKVAHGRCDLDPLSWSGSRVYSARASLEPEGKTGWRKIEADSLQAELDWSGVRRGVWSVPTINLDWLRVSLAAANAPAVTQASDAKTAPDERPSADVSKPAASWLQRWVPQRTEIGEVKVDNFELNPALAGGGVAIDHLKLKAKPAVDEGAWHLRGDGGTLILPGIREPFQLNSATVRLDARTLSLEDADARWKGGSDVTSRGEFSFATGAWNFGGRISGLDLREVLESGWRSKLSGVVETDYDVSSKPGTPVIYKGKVRVKSGVVQGLPVLARVADFTHTERFRRVVLDEAAMSFERQEDRLRISEIVLQSNGLIRIEGEVVLRGRSIDGRLLVGVSPETLRWMPGAQNHVFTEAHPRGLPGFVWTNVVISGTTDSPKENLSSRLLAAAGQAVLIDTPMEILGAGADVLGKTGGAAAEGGRAVIDTGREVIKGAGDAVGRTVDAVQGLIPLIPK